MLCALPTYKKKEQYNQYFTLASAIARFKSFRKCMGASKNKLQNIRQLWEVCQTAGLSIPVIKCQKFVESMPRQRNAVIRNMNQ